MNEIAKPNYEQLITKIGSTLAEGKSRVAAAINTALVQSYWTIGLSGNISLSMSSKAMSVQSMAATYLIAWPRTSANGMAQV